VVVGTDGIPEFRPVAARLQASPTSDCHGGGTGESDLRLPMAMMFLGRKMKEQKDALFGLVVEFASSQLLPLTASTCGGEASAPGFRRAYHVKGVTSN
jgi:hypothetical protein